MVKAKFGALALTVLMGLGAVSPLHGVTEAHALLPCSFSFSTTPMTFTS